MTSAKEALKRLEDGNDRFVANQEENGRFVTPIQHNYEKSAQKPHTIILGCSDARVPAEIIFNQGLGELFVIRVAGNIVAPSQIGSIEFAASQFGTRLVVVLGHSNCGAVKARLSRVKFGTRRRFSKLKINN